MKYGRFGTGEGVFVPTNECEFMRMTPLWRLDVLGDLAEAIERTQQHAAVEYFGGSIGRTRVGRWSNGYTRPKDVY